MTYLWLEVSPDAMFANFRLRAFLCSEGVFFQLAIEFLSVVVIDCVRESGRKRKLVLDLRRVGDVRVKLSAAQAARGRLRGDSERYVK